MQVPDSAAYVRLVLLLECRFFYLADTVRLALAGFERRIGRDGGKGKCAYQALAVIVAASVAISFTCLHFAFLCRHRKNRLLEPDHLCASSSPLPIFAPDGTSSELSSSWSLYGSAVDSSLKKLSLDDLAWATSEFSPDNIIGDDSFGFVYRVVLPDYGLAVVVKRLFADHAVGAGNRS
ncbi:leucine-rich repeat receptor protein kinase MSL1 [Hordeum vulgare]|nr:leucine-rich repeat receptor protein kinase MSL1 [Hordeum vulgare]